MAAHTTDPHGCCCANPDVEARLAAVAAALPAALRTPGADPVAAVSAALARYEERVAALASQVATLQATVIALDAQRDRAWANRDELAAALAAAAGVRCRHDGICAGG